VKSKSTEFVAPLGQAKRGRLVLLSGASGITLLADLVLPDLARGRFTLQAPHIEINEGALILQFRHFDCFDQKVFLGEPLGEIRLNISIPWEIEFRDGVSNLNADLGGLQLRSLDVLGSAEDVTLELSQPAETGFIYISGDAHQVSILRPPQAGVRLSVIGGIHTLSLDGRHFAEIEGEARLESSGLTSSTPRYEIGIAGGASHLTIKER